MAVYLWHADSYWCSNFLCVSSGCSKNGDALSRVEVSDDEESRRKGLGGRLGMDENYAMLFVFDNSDRHQMWMKDMNFSVDIIWINERKRVVHVRHNVKPDTEPYEKYSPTVPARYVLEVKAGVAKRAGVTVGSPVKFDLEENK